jgi:1-acyl-sn-glycerol-3-phosphate acyltransferase
MDALAILNTCKTDTVFMARADIFRKKRQAALLKFFKILPIYRIRDGVGELSKNDEVFNSALDVLDDGVPVCLMPEGNHGNKRLLRPLVKGAFRIALRAQEEFKDKNEVKIIPVGIDYEHYQKFFQDILIIYGQPIEVSEYFHEWEGNPAVGTNKLRDRLALEMKKNIINIENEELYEMYNDLRSIYNKRMSVKAGILGRSHYERFRADKQMIRILDEKFKSHPDVLRDLGVKVKDYMKSLDELNIRNWIFERSGFTTKKLIYKRFGLILSFPFFLYGLINNYLPYRIPVYKTKKLKDPQFVSSFKFVLAMILFPVFYGLQTLLVAILTGPAWIPLAYLITLPASGYFALFWSIWYKRWRAGLKYRKMKRSRNEKILSLERKYKEIMETMDSIVDDYLKRIDLKDQKMNYV